MTSNERDTVRERDPSQTWCGIVWRSHAMDRLVAEARLAATTDAAVLILGPTGTGKELLARAIHDASARRRGPFVAVNCSAIPETLLESELFGNVQGAFTGADRARRGLFHAAHRGTLLLDEIGDMPLALQAKLLRVVEDQEVRPLGATEASRVDVRIVSSSHRDLEEMTVAGDFREDLYYRLDVVRFDVPPLGERRDDIPLLAARFLERSALKHGKPVTGLASDALEILREAPWPGNVRQLVNVIEQCVVLSTEPVLTSTLVSRALGMRARRPAAFEEARDRFEHEYLERLLTTTAGNVSRAAAIAGRNRTEFYRLLHRHALEPRGFKRVPG